MTRNYFASLALLAIFDVVLLVWLGSAERFAWAAENGPIENFEAALLAVIAILFGWRAAASAPAVRPLNVALSVLAAMILLREIDLRQTRAPRFLTDLLHAYHGRRILIGAIAVALLVYLLRRRRESLAALRALWRPALLAYLAPGVLLVIGSVFEEASGGGYWVVLEEVSEMNGFLLLLLAGMFFPL